MEETDNYADMYELIRYLHDSRVTLTMTRHLEMHPDGDPMHVATVHVHATYKGETSTLEMINLADYVGDGEYEDWSCGH